MDLHEKIRTLPASPGVYLYKNADGEVIYVGKAKSLRHRVGSYFHSGRVEDAKTGTLLREALETANEFLAKAQASGDSVPLMMAHRVMGSTLLTIGEFQASRQHFEAFDHRGGFRPAGEPQPLAGSVPRL